MSVTELPQGMSVRIEGAKLATDDAYRRGEPDPGRLVIEYRWRDTEDLHAQVIGCIFFWVVVGVLALVLAGPNPSWFAFPLWLLILALAVMVSWVVAMSVWNRTTITVDGERLLVRHGRFSISPTRQISRRDLDEVYSRGVTDAQLYALFARLRSGDEVAIMAYLVEPQLCQIAAEQITAYLERTRPAPGP